MRELARGRGRGERGERTLLARVEPTRTQIERSRKLHYFFFCYKVYLTLALRLYKGCFVRKRVLYVIPDLELNLCLLHPNLGRYFLKIQKQIFTNPSFVIFVGRFFGVLC